jgi:hypothetical protein
MTDLEESQRVTIERLQKEIEDWKKKYSDQIKTDKEWELYIKKSREEGEEQSKQKVISWTLGLLWALLVIYELRY